MRSRLTKAYSRNPLSGKVVSYLFGGVFFLLNFNCGESHFQPLYYFPIKTGHSWTFDGDIYKMEILEIPNQPGDKIVTFAYYDTLSTILWKEEYTLLKNQIFLQSFEPSLSVLPTVTFEPALPFAPISGKVGQKQLIKSIETQTDTLVHTTAIEVEYLIESIEDVKVPAGTFLDCIKMKINFLYPPTPYRPLFFGEQYWWFAPLIGPVKYDLPSAQGELVSMNVSRGRPLQPPQ